MTVWLACGSHTSVDERLVYTELLDRMPMEALVHGDALFTDRMAGQWARDNGIPEIKLAANWDIYGRSAGPLRNEWMLRFIKVDKVVAFPGGPGTMNMIRTAKSVGIPVEIVVP